MTVQEETWLLFCLSGTETEPLDHSLPSKCSSTPGCRYCVSFIIWSECKRLTRAQDARKHEVLMLKFVSFNKKVGDTNEYLSSASIERNKVISAFTTRKKG